MSILAAIVVLLGLLAVGIPVAISLLAAGSVGLIIFGGGQLFLGVLGAGPGSALVSYELLTVPMFLFMAELMVASGISHTLFVVWVLLQLSQVRHLAPFLDQAQPLQQLCLHQVFQPC